jgi:hypothetical protein
LPPGGRLEEAPGVARCDDLIRFLDYGRLELLHQPVETAIRSIALTEAMRRAGSISLAD